MGAENTGNPTVILETLASGLSLYWAWVQPDVAKTTRVCAYDRAGRAWSEVAARPLSLQQARASLRLALHRLRRQIDPFLLVTRQDIGLNRGTAIEVDALRFEACLADGRVERATDLYQGDFLDGFYLDDSPAFEQWALLERERLCALALSAWQRQIEQLTTAGHVQRAVNGAQRLLQLDPLHEPTHRQLMRLLAQSGQRSAALAQSEICRHLLTTELAAPPDEATTLLAEQIRTGELNKVAR